MSVPRRLKLRESGVDQFQHHSEVATMAGFVALRVYPNSPGKQKIQILGQVADIENYLAVLKFSNSGCYAITVTFLTIQIRLYYSAFIQPGITKAPSKIFGIGPTNHILLSLTSESCKNIYAFNTLMPQGHSMASDNTSLASPKCSACWKSDLKWDACSFAN
ncbi:predicted protein [Histoplasma capsulatum var. duboisii H88]|uniref:Predicted protein n=1 Tax=Ajellomyces capsulatus (strain H88) TaxID=544711 RepID=F0UPF5_AJEC8|nr:predicted protein [Histoplasma capsulatum var. duboisii H88]